MLLTDGNFVLAKVKSKFLGLDCVVSKEDLITDKIILKKFTLMMKLETLERR